MQNLASRGASRGKLTAVHVPAAVELGVQGGALRLRNPVITASGTFAYGLKLAPLVNLNRLGGLVVKGLSREPMDNAPALRLCDTPSGMLNAVGLQNTRSVRVRQGQAVAPSAGYRSHCPRGRGSWGGGFARGEHLPGGKRGLEGAEVPAGQPGWWVIAARNQVDHPAPGSWREAGGQAAQHWLGGIESPEDVLENLVVGATAVQVGAASFAGPTATERIASGLEDLCAAFKIFNINELREKVVKKTLDLRDRL